MPLETRGSQKLLFDPLRHLYVAYFFNLDTCLKEYYESSGLERRVSSAAKSCSYIIRPERYLSRVVVWFENLTISENNFVTVSLMSVSDKLITQHNLSSNSSGRWKSFDGLNRGNWFEIRQSADVTFDLKFKTYSGRKLFGHDFFRAKS